MVTLSRKASASDSNAKLATREVEEDVSEFNAVKTRRSPAPSASIDVTQVRDSSGMERTASMISAQKDTQWNKSQDLSRDVSRIVTEASLKELMDNAQGSAAIMVSSF